MPDLFVALAVAALPRMTQGGSIVGLTFDASFAWPVYDWMGVAKAALEASVRYLAYELGPKGVRVNSLHPGHIRTPLTEHFPDDLRPGRPSRWLAHFSTAVEGLVPLVLFFSGGGWPTPGATGTKSGMRPVRCWASTTARSKWPRARSSSSWACRGRASRRCCAR